MSWLLNKLLDPPERSEPRRDEDEDEDEDEEENDEVGGENAEKWKLNSGAEHPRSGITEDLSQLKSTFAKHLFGVASFIAGETESLLPQPKPSQGASGGASLADGVSDHPNASRDGRSSDASSEAPSQGGLDAAAMASSPEGGRRGEEGEGIPQTGNRNDDTRPPEPVVSSSTDHRGASSPTSPYDDSSAHPTAVDESGNRTVGSSGEVRTTDDRDNSQRDDRRSNRTAEEPEGESGDQAVKNPKESSAQFSGMRSDLAELSISMASGLSKFSSALWSVSGAHHPSSAQNHSAWFPSHSTHAEPGESLDHEELEEKDASQHHPPSSSTSLAASTASSTATAVAASASKAVAAVVAVARGGHASNVHQSSASHSIPEDANDIRTSNQETQSRDEIGSESHSDLLPENSLNDVNEKEALLNAVNDDLTAITHTISKGIGGISRFASTFLSFQLEPGSRGRRDGEDDEDDEYGDDEDNVEDEEENEVPLVGLSDNIVTFVATITSHPETWIDFPLAKIKSGEQEVEEDEEEEEEEDFILTEIQEAHLDAMEERVPRLPSLRLKLSPSNMSESKFILIYFVLLHSKLSKEEAHLLSTPQVLKARNKVLEALRQDGESINDDDKNNKNDNDKDKSEIKFVNDEVGGIYDAVLHLTAEIEPEHNAPTSASSSSSTTSAAAAASTSSPSSAAADASSSSSSSSALFSSTATSATTTLSSTTTSVSTSALPTSVSLASAKSGSKKENEEKSAKETSKVIENQNDNEVDEDDWLDELPDVSADKGEDDLDESSWIRVDKE